MTIIVLLIAACSVPLAIFCYFYSGVLQEKHLAWQRFEPHLGETAWKRYQSLNERGWHKVDAWSDATVGFTAMVIFLYVAGVVDTINSLLQMFGIQMRENFDYFIYTIFTICSIVLLINLFNCSRHLWKYRYPKSLLA